MGKSRLLDEFSKHFFMIPINLCDAGSRGLSYQCHLEGLLNLSYRLSPPRTTKFVTSSQRTILLLLKALHLESETSSLHFSKRSLRNLRNLSWAMINLPALKSFASSCQRIKIWKARVKTDVSSIRVSYLRLEKYAKDSCSFSPCLTHCFKVIRITSLSASDGQGISGKVGGALKCTQA